MVETQFAQVNKTSKNTDVIGRQTILKQVLALLSIAEETGAFLFGHPGLGKTSVLSALCHQMQSHVIVYVNPQALDNDDLETILTDIVQKSANQLGIDIEISDSPIDDFTRQLLPQIHNICALDNRLILCIDSFDLSNKNQSQTIHPFFLWLKAIEKEFQGKLFFIVTGGESITDLTDIYMPLFSKCRLIHLPPMIFQETMALVRNIERNNSIQWPEKIIRAIHELSGGYPLIIDAICREFRNLPYGSSPFQTFESAMLRYQNNMEKMWEGLSTNQKLVIACLSESKEGMTQWQIEHRLDEIRASLYYKRVIHALQMLEIWQVIYQENNVYHIHCHFFSSWIQRNHPAQTILSKTADLPLVSDYLYQASLHLFQTDQIQDALKVGQHIIQMHPKHIEANQMVADILIARDRCIEAQKILEHLYTINSEAARSRLINALKIQAEALEMLYAYSVEDWHHTPINSYLKNIKLRYADRKDQNNHLLLVYEKILNLAPKTPDIHEKYVNLILKHQKIKDYQRKIAYEKDIQSHELNAYLLTEATAKVKQLQNRILFSQVYLKALDALIKKDIQSACDLLVRVVYMDERCKDARRFLYIAKHYTPEIEQSIQSSLRFKPESEHSMSEQLKSEQLRSSEIIDIETEESQLMEQANPKNNIFLWIFLTMLIMVAIYVMMDGSLK